jgi:hypothetical protein
MKAPELAAAIAPHLPGWTFEPAYDHIAYLVRADGARIGVMVGSWSAKGRVSIAGMWPKFADGPTYWSSRERAEITCAATRTPEAIAREIQRRLIPGYDHEYAIARAYVDRHNANVHDAKAVAARIAAVVGGHPSTDATRRGDGVHIHGGPDAVYRLRVDPERGTHGVSVSCELHDLDPETAAEVLAVIKTAEERKQRVAVDARVEQELVDDWNEEQDERAKRRRRVG